ncbi:hypothetical protein PAXINDRAFT_166983 [Paxillus involutus ATCC 200175]|nr:hypothetical protein PAXINDRAFT_166983 [Paxillus involutus ATCC 200175]
MMNQSDSYHAGYHAGMIESLYFATQAMTILQWSRASDRVGRKPVLLLGIFGLSLSMLQFITYIYDFGIKVAGECTRPDPRTLSGFGGTTD